MKKTKISKIILILFCSFLIATKLNAQREIESPGAEDWPTRINHNYPCDLPLNTNKINCNLIIYCYDATGNRIYRFTPNCNPNFPPTNGGSSPMAFKNTDNIYELNMDILYPNPTTGSAELKFDRFIENGVLNIMSSDGKIIKSIEFSDTKVKFDLTNYAEGQYLIVIKSTEKNITKTIIKSK